MIPLNQKEEIIVPLTCLIRTKSKFWPDSKIFLKPPRTYFESRVARLLKFQNEAIERIQKMLYFCHLKFPHSHQAIPRSDLVPKTQANLGSCEGKSPSIELKQLIEIAEDALSGLGAQEGSVVCWWADLGLEHKIKLFRWGEVISSIRRLDFVFLEYLGELLLSKSIDPYQQAL